MRGRTRLIDSKPSWLSQLAKLTLAEHWGAAITWSDLLMACGPALGLWCRGDSAALMYALPTILIDWTWPDAGGGGRPI
jgi:hypothetical protein